MTGTVQYDGSEVMWRGDFRFLALLGMTQWQGFVVSPSDPVSSTGIGFDSSPIKGEGVMQLV